MNRFCRTEKMLGHDALSKLQSSSVAVFGLGGVGSYTVEALARAGVGSLTLIDDDVLCESNVNRQLYALQSTLGQYKADVAKARVLDINPDCNVTAMRMRFDASTVNNVDFTAFNYVVDAIDTVTSKLLLISCCKSVNTPIISCMGTGNKLNPSLFQIADISQTSVCPLAKVMRKELKNRAITDVKVLFSAEQPVKICSSDAEQRVPSSISFVPSVAGLLIAGEVVRDLIEEI